MICYKVTSKQIYLGRQHAVVSARVCHQGARPLHYVDYQPSLGKGQEPLSVGDSCKLFLRNIVHIKSYNYFIQVDTLKFGLCLYVLTYVGAWFNALTLVILAWIGVFTLPKLYLNNQAAVDEVVGKVAGQVNEVKAKVVEALPANMKPKIGVKEE